MTEDAASARENVRARLAQPAGQEPASDWLGGDEGHDAAATRVPAAVLLGLVPRSEGPTVLLTQRTAHLKDHAGQISLPGGRLEPGEDPVAAALREADEEIGLSADRVEVLGELRPYLTGTGFRIHPVVGWVDPPERFTTDPFEVEELFELPLGFVMDPANHRQDSYERNGRRRRFYVLPYAGRYIWGATAGILVNFARVLRQGS
jgi:8-oxo-dGTP pyrophosphatase MutT (NUDIX family)